MESFFIEVCFQVGDIVLVEKTVKWERQNFQNIINVTRGDIHDVFFISFPFSSGVCDFLILSSSYGKTGLTPACSS